MAAPGQAVHPQAPARLPTARPAALAGSVAPPPAAAFHAASLAGLELLNVKAEVVTYQGRRAVRLLHQPGKSAAERRARQHGLAILTAADFADGTIEAEVAGLPRAGAAKTARGFIGVAFRVQGHGARFDCIYIRPTNGRAEDQLRRNHSTQYISHPDFSWKRLRREHPGLYESYVDLEAGAWTRLKIVVAGTTARLYVHDAPQPALVVDDLKLGRSRGRIALWVGDETDGYFSSLTVRSR